MPSGDARQRWLGPAAALLAACLLLALCAPAVARLALQRPVARDEHQFVASATLLARQGLLPYRDYPYFHLPYQVPVQALAIRLGLDPLAACRLVSLACGLGCLVLVFWGGLHFLRGLPWWARWPLALALPLFMALTPLFRYTTGRAWNHDLALFLALAACLAHGRGLETERPGPWLLASGLLLGLAIASRAAWGPALLAFLASLFWPGPRVRAASPGRVALPFLAGFGLAALPGLLLFLACPADTFFGAVVYPGQLTTRYWAEQDYGKAMDWAGKLAYLYRDVWNGPGDFRLLGTYKLTALLFGATLLLGLPLGLWAWARQRRQAGGQGRGLAFLLLLLPVALLGSMLPSPNMYQYYYQLEPFCLLLLALALGRALAGLPGPGARAGLAGGLALLAVYLLAAGGHGLWRQDAQALAEGGPWHAEQALAVGQELARRLPQDSLMLTLAPIYALEGGLRIYPPLATGPFALRVAHLLPVKQRQARRMLAPSDLAGYLAGQPPAAILTGVEPDLDATLTAYAQAHGYGPQRLASDPSLVLWTPAASAQLGEGEGRP